MKTLFIDTENGYKSLGSKEDLESLFGYPVFQPGTWEAFTSTLTGLFEHSKEKVEHKVGNIVVEEEQILFRPKASTDVDMLVIDTGTELMMKLSSQVKKGSGPSLTQQEWGEIKSYWRKLMEMLNGLSVNLIMNVHLRAEEDESGITRYVPSIEGSSRHDIAKWFDFVFYTKTVLEPDGSKSYKWVTSRTEQFPHAKDRSGILEDEIDQDYAMVMAAVESRGWDVARILVCGTPGSGKTLALKSLIVNNNQKTEVEKNGTIHASV